MKAGRELDALVAEKVMGIGCGILPPHDHIPYSTDIAAAWQVVEKMRERCAKADYFTLKTLWYASGEVYYCEFGRGGQAWNKSAPEAICLAALKALGVEPGTGGEGR